MTKIFRTLSVAVAVSFLLCATVGATTLVVATHINEIDPANAQVDLMKGFEKTHPDVEVEIWHSPWAEYHDRLLTMYLGGAGPDVATVGRLQFASFIEAGIFQPLDQFITADPTIDIKKDAVPGILFSGIYKGQVYGFPVYNGPALLFYNPSMFAQRGVAEPVDYVESNTWNRETFLQVAKKLTYDAAGRGTPTHFGYFGFTEWQPMWISYIRHAGGDVITSDGRSGLNMAETIESLEWLNDLNVLHGVTAHPGPGGASWESGTIAMHIRWQSAGLVEKNLYPAVDPEPAPIPAGPKGYAHLVGGVPACVATSAQDPQLAYQYAKWFGMESDIWKLRGGPPLSWKQVRGPEYRATLRAFRNPSMFDMALVGDARPEPEFGFVEYAEINNILSNVLINPIRQGQVSVRAAVSEAHRLLTQILEK